MKYSFIHKKGHPAIFNNKDGPWVYYVKSNKSVRKRQTMLWFVSFFLLFMPWLFSSCCLKIFVFLMSLNIVCLKCVCCFFMFLYVFSFMFSDLLRLVFWTINNLGNLLTITSSNIAPAQLTFFSFWKYVCIYTRLSDIPSQLLNLLNTQFSFFPLCTLGDFFGIF